MKVAIALVAIQLLTAGITGASSQRESETFSIIPQRIVFPSQAVGAESIPETITIKNAGSGLIRINQVLSSGIDFTISTSCSQELASAAECTVQVMFRPAVAGDRTGVVEIVASDDSSPHFVSLSGTGL